jgi:hypothetical protein
MGSFIALTAGFGLNDGYIEDGVITGHIVHIDHCAKLISYIHQRFLPPTGQSISIKFAGTAIRGLAPESRSRERAITGRIKG